MAVDTDQRVQSDLQAQLEASHAEVAHMQKQIAATTAALHSARASDNAHVSYPAPGDTDYSEDSLIRSVCKSSVKLLCTKCPSLLAVSQNGNMRVASEKVCMRKCASAPLVPA